MTELEINYLLFTVYCLDVHRMGIENDLLPHKAPPPSDLKTLSAGLVMAYGPPCSTKQS
jgi:hypothetical protein